MKNELSKSTETAQKEEKIKTLETQLKKKNTTLKRLKTRLLNTKNEIDEMQRKVQSQLFTRLDELQDLRLEIIELAKALKKVKSMSEGDKHALGEMIEELIDGEMFGEMFQYYQEQKQAHEDKMPETEEDRRAKMHDLFAQFQVVPEEAEQQDIRKIFLRLSKSFHPDRAKNEEELDHFHKMMQQINDAYKNNDTQTLLDLEQAHLPLNDAPDNTSDALQMDIDRLQREIDLIDHQIQRTSQEIKNFGNSQLGTIKKGIKAAEITGDTFEEFTQGFDGMLAMFSIMRDGLKDSIERGRISPILTEMLQEENEEEAFEEFMESLGIDVSHFFDEDDGDDLQDLEEVENPKFPLDSSVRIAHSILSPFSKKVDMKGWEGRIIDVYKENGEVIYEVDFDSITIQQMPETVVKGAFENGEAFHSCALQESHLEACPPRDQEDDSYPAYRLRFHEVNWLYLPKKQQERLKNILLTQPDETDEENWDVFLEGNLKFPFKAKTRALLGADENIAVWVLGFDFYDEEYGHIVTIGLTKTKDQQSYPLMGLKSATKKADVAPILDDYCEWALNSKGMLH